VKPKIVVGTALALALCIGTGLATGRSRWTLDIAGFNPSAQTVDLRLTNDSWTPKSAFPLMAGFSVWGYSRKGQVMDQRHALSHIAVKQLDPVGPQGTITRTLAIEEITGSFRNKFDQDIYFNLSYSNLGLSPGKIFWLFDEPPCELTIPCHAEIKGGKIARIERMPASQWPPDPTPDPTDARRILTQRFSAGGLPSGFWLDVHPNGGYVLTEITSGRHERIKIARDGRLTIEPKGGVTWVRKLSTDPASLDRLLSECEKVNPDRIIEVALLRLSGDGFFVNLYSYPHKPGGDISVYATKGGRLTGTVGGM
jgi:hypothetical protein